MNTATNNTPAAPAFRFQSGSVTLESRIEGEGPAAQIVFSGGASGEHSLFLNVSSPERLAAHWAGYVEQNTAKAPAPAVRLQKVTFPSKSAPGGTRTGHILRTTATRALVQYRFKTGRVTTKWVPLAKVAYWP